MDRPRLLLADDHAATRVLLRNLLDAEFDVIAEVSEGRALVVAAAQLSPDAIVTDISMTGLDGIMAAAIICGENPEARIVFVTVHAEAVMVDRGLATGALGYVLKEAAGDDLLPAVRAALRGESYVSRALISPERRD